MEKFYTLEEAAQLLHISPHSLADRRYRALHHLAARKVGRRLLFAESDLAKIIDEAKEFLPSQTILQKPNG